MEHSAARAEECGQCAKLYHFARPQRNYQHVHRAEVLPRASGGATHRIIRGYAVLVGGALPASWFFFDYLEPALVFGRAAGMSWETSEFELFEAARELRENPGTGQALVTLHVLLSGDPRLGHDEADVFRRWAQNVDPRTAHYYPSRPA
jgi:hypothetical protein